MKIFGIDPLQLLGIQTTKAITKLPLPKGTITQLPPSAGTMYNNPGTVTWMAGNAQSQIKDGYSGNDIVYSCIRLIVDKVKLAPWAEYKVVDKKAYKKYCDLTEYPEKVKDWKEVEKIRSKALEIVKVGSKITDLLERPNEQDSWGDLVESYSIFKLSTGNAYVYGKTIPTGRNQGKPLELHTLPSQYMSIIADLSKFPIEPTGYQLYMQFTQTFTKQEILHDKYSNPNWNIVGNQLYGLSPLQPLSRVLTRSNEGKKAAVANYQNGGPKGILFVNDDRHDPAQTVQEAMDLKKTLARNQGSENVNQVETSAYKVDYVQLGSNVVDLDLYTVEGLDTQAITNAFGVPAALLGVKGGMTYNGMPEAEKALTVRCAIPMLSSIRDQFNRKFETDWGKMDTVIDYDISVYKELEENKKELVEWLKDAPLTIRKKLEYLGESTEGYTEEQLNSIIISNGFTTLDDVLAQQPINIPNGLNDYGQ
jgi:HK97 family phage portal protein